MKKLLIYLLFLVTLVFSADVKPFYYDYIPNDSASQQDEFDYMLKYKLFGRDYLKMGIRVNIPDKSGWNGSTYNISSSEGLVLGGPTLAGGSISVGNECQLTTGPIRGTSFTAGNSNGKSVFAGIMCLADTNVTTNVRDGLTKGEGSLAIECPTVPEPPMKLSIPTIPWPDAMTHEDIIINANGTEDASTYYIDVPDGDSKEPYDIYINTIDANKTSSKDGAKIYIRMQDGGRLTRIFVHNLLIGNHTTLQVVYRTDEGDVIQAQSKYRGNVLFYSDNDINFFNTDNVPIQGTFISLTKIYLNCNLDFSGQLLANELEIGNDFKGENFKFVPFDTPVVDIDPELNKTGGLKENDSTVVIPIKLSDTATVDVYFSYCFDLNENVTIDDFTMVGDFPICGEGESKTVIIPIGQKWPSDSIKVNVKRDDLVELNDTLVIRINIESGAVLPNNKTDGVLKIKIIDSDVFQLNTDGIIKSVEENKANVSLGKVELIGKTDTSVISIADKDTARFAIDPVTGEITLKEAIDYETENEVVFTIIAIDGTQHTDANISIKIIDVNENPVIKDQEFSFPEVWSNVISIGEVKIADADTAKKFTNNKVYLADTTDFIITGNKIYIKHDFDYESDPHDYKVKVYVEDKNDPSLKDSAYITINLTNVNETPKLDSAKISVYENYTGVVDTITAVDPDGDKLTYKVTTAGWKITDDGILSITKELDYETTPSTNVTVIVTDGEKSDTLTYKVTVKNVNEPIHVNDTTFTISENKKGTVGKVNAWDEDGDKIYYSVSDTSKYEIKYDGVLSVKTPFDYETTKSDTVKIYVEDGNNMIDSAIIIINIENVNEPMHIDSSKITIPENTKINTPIDTIHGYDEDGDVITYKIVNSDIVTIKDSVIYLNKDVDYEKVKDYVITVVATTKNDTNTFTIPLSITNVNEPVHVQDTTLTIPENQTGVIGTVNAWDEDGENDKINYSISDTERFNIDSLTGTITLKVPYDYESTTKDSVIVYVRDQSGLTDSAVIKINVKNEIETSKVEIILTETRDSIWHTDTVYTNTPDIKIDWKADSSVKFTDTTVVPGKNIIELCYQDPTKDAKACDTVVVLFSNTSPIVTVAKVDEKETSINGITIVEEVDAKDTNIYVNNKLNDIQVIVKDPATGETEKFNITVELDTVKIPTKNFEKYGYIVDIDKTDLKYEVVGENKVKYTETIKVDGQEVNLYYIGDTTGSPIDTVRYVEYTKTINGQPITFTYKTDDLGNIISDYEVKYNYVDQNGNVINVAYTCDNEGTIKKNEDGSLGYKVSYTYTNKYGNSGTSEVFIALETVPPKVQILTPIESESYYTNSIQVVWTVDGMEQDTLNLERLEKGINKVIRMYKDKYGNIGADTVYVFMKNAKDIEVAMVNPVTEIKQDKVDEYYSNGGKYNPKEPVQVLVKDPKSDDLPEPVGIGLKVNIVLPSLSSTGGLATIDDMVQTVNGKTGILVNKEGKLISGTSTGADGSYTISTDEYINDHCNDEFKKEYKKNGLEHTTIWDVTYKMHIWIFNNNANYVNDFNFSYKLDDTNLADDAGMLVMVIDWLAAKDGYVKSADGNAIATGAYLTKLEATSISTTRCDLPNQPIGTKVKKSENDMKSFGYKRPVTK